MIDRQDHDGDAPYCGLADKLGTIPTKVFDPLVSPGIEEFG